ncbi:putative membrane-associated protein, DedA family [Halalkaliarchaeum sp. AArc-CO]|uniref:DedA family protein n=1 Tax=unclassified Halalkaliarchaeum TaxID=2678344 RepID=UPI00217CD57A|nr:MULTISPECIES: membrane-associated protein [unclassified Halalkaliarchaeum]MDR5672593.1 membrane-associated protein [Halalkaliarchaeum sp. AArc-GB]UWG50453.1 putative membrane-associated protein, DedA family [Halalkaliarchaeum sp. AArc-CO]
MPLELDLAGRALAFAVAVGGPALVILFYFEGMFVGKILQPPLVFVGYVAATVPSWPKLALLGGAVTVAATLGQWTLARGFDEDASELFGIRRTVPGLDRIPETVERRVGDRRLAIVERYFDAYGGWAVAVSNLVPGIRGVMAIPAGLGGYPSGQFLLAAAVGNVAYVALLIAAASGVRGLARLAGV